MYYDEAGMLTKVAGTVYFIGATTQDLTEVELETLSALTVLGRCDLADSPVGRGRHERRPGSHRL